MRGRLARWEGATLVLITAAAAALRLLHLGRVPPDPFYDAAVRSMGLSWHNFFFGAAEPGGSVSIDKPPVDLWLQVASVKLLGFSSTTLKLPEALAGIGSVPLLFAAVRRVWSPAAGLAAALALAVLPVSVITSRSDTMDAVMMLLLVLALLLVLRACETGATRWLLAAAAVLGLAFNVKLLESLVALPGLLVIAYLGMPVQARRRLLAFAAAGAVYLVVALSWLTATLLAPAHERPWAIGSTNGSAWNAAFVFNGSDRLGSRSPESQSRVYEPGHRYPVATQAQRDHIPIVPPSATRLLARIGPLSGQRLGLEALAALSLGIPALLLGALRPAREGRGRASPGASERRADSEQGLRVRRAFAAGIGLWMLTGLVLFSSMSRLHPRYVEAFTPAVAAMLGIGAAWAAQPRGRLRRAILAATLVIVVYYGERLLYGTPAAWWVTLLAALGAIAGAALAWLGAGPRPLIRMLAPGAVLALALTAILAIPLGADFRAIKDRVSDAGYVGALPPQEQRLASSFLRAHQGGARYEVAAESATAIGSLIVQDVRPVLALTSYSARVLTPVDKLKRLIATGQVRYAFLNKACGRHAASTNAACSAPVRWVRAHGTDMSAHAGLPDPQTLWLLPGAKL